MVDFRVEYPEIYEPNSDPIKPIPAIVWGGVAVVVKIGIDTIETSIAGAPGATAVKALAVTTTSLIGFGAAKSQSPSMSDEQKAMTFLSITGGVLGGPVGGAIGFGLGKVLGSIPHSDMQGITMHAAEGYYGDGSNDRQPEQPSVPHPSSTKNTAPTSRPSDEAIQFSRHIVDGNAYNYGNRIYPDDAIRRVAAAQTKREQEIADARRVAEAQAEAARQAAWQQEFNRDRQGGDDSSPSPSSTSTINNGQVHIPAGTPNSVRVPGVNYGGQDADARREGGSHGTPTRTSHASRNGFPIVIDLDGDGVEISPLGGSTARFDYDNDGFRELTAWVGSDDGLLVYDIGGDGQVTEAKEVVIADWTESTTDTDLDALRTVFDTNNDGLLNADDTGWTNFKVWNDRDQDGAVDTGEMSTLADRNIQALDLTRKEDTDITFGDGSILHGLFDVFKTDGTKVLGGDVAFRHQVNGVRETVVNGVTTLEFEGGDSVSFNTMAEGEVNFTLIAPFIGAQGNALNNQIDASALTVDVMIDGGAGDDTILGGSGRDVLSGGAGVDDISAGAGDDVVYTDRNDVLAQISGGAGYDMLIMSEDSQILTDNVDQYGFEAIFAGDLNDSMRATLDDVNHQLHGNGGDDTVIGAAANDLLTGGDGADLLQGGFGEDILMGGTGNDTLEGGHGDDTYVFGRGDGQDSVLDQVIGVHDAEYDYTHSYDYNYQQDYQYGYHTGGKWSRYVTETRYYTATATATDTRTGVQSVTGEYDGGIDLLQFGEGISVEDITMRRVGADMVIELRSEDDPDIMSGDRITIQDWDDTNNRIEVFRFSDGAVLDVSQLINGFVDDAASTHTVGSSSGDFISAGSGNDVVNAREGDDIVTGGAGNDVLHGENGHDQVWGGQGNDFLAGEDGNDVLLGGDGNDVMSGGIGSDFLFGGNGEDILLAGTGNDVLIGGQGTDRLEGGAGDDTYIWQIGDGRDTILDQQLVQETYQVAYTVDVQRDYGKHAHWVTETRYYQSSRTVNANSGKDVLQFGPGITLENLAFDRSGNSLRIGVRDSLDPNVAMDGLENVLTIELWTDYNTRIETFVMGNGQRLDMTEIEHAISGYGDNDSILGTGYGDILSGGAGNDTLRGLGGSNYLIGGVGDDLLEAAEGNDDLYGGAGADTLYGGNGDDYLLGADGADVLNGGDGKDVLVGGAGNDTLIGGKGNDVYIIARGSGADTIDESAFVTEDYQYTVRVQVEVPTYTTVTTYQTVESGKGTVQKAFKTKVQNGTKMIWVNETRTGQRTVAVEGGDDVLQFSGSIDISDIIVRTSGTNLIIQIQPVNDADPVEDIITVNQWNYTEFRIESFVFENGFSIKTGQISHAKSGTNLANTLVARSDKASWLSGLGGNDTLEGSSYSDILVGGSGNDLLYGGNGDDVYVYERGNGCDTISDSGSFAVSVDNLQLLNGEVFGDKILLGAGITIDDIIIERLGSDLIIRITPASSDTVSGGSGTADIITIQNWDLQEKRVEALQFYDGTDLNISKIVNASTGSSLNDIINGTDVGDWVDGGLGDDSILSGAGDDFLSGRAGNDSLYAGEGHDVLIGAEGNDLLDAGAGDDFALGGDGDDALDGQDGDDVLVGGTGRDTFNGGNGSDVIIGGQGDDVFIASSGQDIYRFGYGDGKDHYRGNSASGYSDQDIVVLEGAIDKNAVWFKRIDNNLVMQLLGSEDRITFEDWFVANSTTSETNNDIAAFVLGSDVLLSQDVNKLVSAMAAFDANDGTTAYGIRAHELPSSVQLVVSSTWQQM